MTEKRQANSLENVYKHILDHSRKYITLYNYFDLIYMEVKTNYILLSIIDKKLMSSFLTLLLIIRVLVSLKRLLHFTMKAKIQPEEKYTSCPNMTLLSLLVAQTSQLLATLIKKR